MRVRVDQAGQHRRLAQIDHLDARRNPDLSLRTDLGDALARSEHHLLRPHLAGYAVEQAAGADGQRPRRRRALQDAAVRSDAGSLTRESPGLWRTLTWRGWRSLCQQR